MNPLIVGIDPMVVGGPVTIAAPSEDWRGVAVVMGARVGITKAVELPWRFYVAGNPHVSHPRPRTRPGAGVSPWRTERGSRARAHPQKRGYLAEIAPER